MGRSVLGRESGRHAWPPLSPGTWDPVAKVANEFMQTKTCSINLFFLCGLSWLIRSDTSFRPIGAMDSALDF